MRSLPEGLMYAAGNCSKAAAKAVHHGAWLSSKGSSASSSQQVSRDLPF